MTPDIEDPYFIDLDDNAELITEYEAAKERRDAADADMQRVREMLLKLLPSSTEVPDGVIGVVNGAARLSYRPHARRQLDQGQLRREYPNVADACTDYVITWVLRTVPGQST